MYIKIYLLGAAAGVKRRGTAHAPACVFYASENLYLAYVIQQRPRACKRQPSARVSKNVRSSTSVSWQQWPGVHLDPPTCRCYIGQTAQIVKYPGSDLAASQSYCCIPKAMVGWERRMRSTLTEKDGLSALEHLRIEIQVHSNLRWGVNNCLIYWLKMWCYSWFWMHTCKI